MPCGASGGQEQEEHQRQQHLGPDSLPPHRLLLPIPPVLRLLKVFKLLKSFRLFLCLILHVPVKLFEDVLDGLLQLRLEIRYDVDVLATMLAV